MDYAALVGIVVGHSVKLVCDFLSRPVSGGCNSGLTFAAGYDFDTAMINRARLYSFLLGLNIKRFVAILKLS